MSEKTKPGIVNRPSKSTASAKVVLKNILAKTKEKMVGVVFTNICTHVVVSWETGMLEVHEWGKPSQLLNPGVKLMKGTTLSVTNKTNQKVIMTFTGSDENCDFTVS